MRWMHSAYFSELQHTLPGLVPVTLRFNRKWHSMSAIDVPYHNPWVAMRTRRLVVSQLTRSMTVQYWQYRLCGSSCPDRRCVGVSAFHSIIYSQAVCQSRVEFVHHQIAEDAENSWFLDSAHRPGNARWDAATVANILDSVLVRWLSQYQVVWHWRHTAGKYQCSDNCIRHYL